MKQIYHHPILCIIALDAQAQLMQTSSTKGPSANFMSGPTVSETKDAAPTSHFHDVWDDDWSQGESGE